MGQICFNGKFIQDDQPVFEATNRGYRYGDGLFETMRLVNGRLSLGDYHFERLFSSLYLLDYELPGLFTQKKIEEEINILCEKNKCVSLARVRLSVFRGNGGLYDSDRKLQYLIECWPLDEGINKLNENGLVLGVYPHGRKSCDPFSNMKSASFMLYAAAADFAQKRQFNDCLVLNMFERIADSTIANLFIINDGVVITPPLSEGCVNGVMRRYLLEQMTKAGITYKESPLRTEDLLHADELFLTNAIRGIRWVKAMGDKTYANTRTVEIFNRFIQTI